MGHVASTTLATQRWNASLGIYQFGARFYSPTLGRFLSADTLVPQPYNPQNLNRFSYVNNNPVNFTDPTGHNFSCGGGLICHDPVSDSIPISGGGGTTYTSGGGGGGGGDGGSGGGGSSSGGGTTVGTASTPVDLAMSCVYSIVNCYEQGWTNAGSAWSICTSHAGFGASLGACSYDVVWTEANAVVIIGSGIAIAGSITQIGAAGATTCVAEPTECEDVASNAIGETGSIGENWLNQFGGISQKSFSTTQGARYVDQLINNMAYESKVGYTALTNRVSLQVAKDVELLNTGLVKSVSWFFSKAQSQVVGGRVLHYMIYSTKMG